MKKFFDRWHTSRWFCVGLLLVSFGLRCGWIAAHHHGTGYIMAGGPAPEASGAADSDYSELEITESEYKGRFYVYCAVLIALAVMVFKAAIKGWHERDELEKTWRRLVADPDGLKDVYRNPSVYREDFKQWIRENHPHLAVVELPPDSRN